MPAEYMLLKDLPSPIDNCPKCGAKFEPFLRGTVQRMRGRKWFFFGPYIGYCALICRACKEIVGYE